MKDNMTWKRENISEDEIKRKIQISLGLLYKNDSFLLEESVHERSVTHKLAEYLQQQFLDWHVDCEYNKHGISSKKLPRDCEDVHKEFVFPDIVIHHRNSDDNLVVIEAKPSKSDIVNDCDNIKLIEFTKQNGEYKYLLGMFIGFDGINEPQLEFYQNGRKL